MLELVAYAFGLVIGTTLVHVGCTALVLAWLRSATGHHWSMRNNLTRSLVLGGLVLGMSLAAVTESTLWAFCYAAVGALPDLDASLYFSLVTYTTLGYGDLVLGEEWRPLAAFQAANGIIMFGWTTALIVAVAQRLLVHHPPRSNGG